MRIAYVCADPGIPVFGCKGASIHVQDVIRAMRRAGHHVTLIASRLGADVPRDLHDLPVMPLPSIREAIGATREHALMEQGAAIRAALDGCDALDLVYERYSLWSDAGPTWAAARSIPSILEVNAPLILEQSEHRVLHDRESAEEIARSVFSVATVVAAVSSAVAAYVRDLAGERRVCVVPNGIDPERFAIPSWERRVSKQPFTVGFLGTLKPWHGVEHLIRAFALVRLSVPTARMLVVGDGPQRSVLERLCTELLSDPASVEFTGAVAAERVPEVLGRMDVAVAPYPAITDFYFSPLKVVEYMAAGLAIVASRSGQITELITDGDTGVLVPPGDPEALARALLLLYRNPRLRLEVASRARDDAMAHRTWDAVVARLLGETTRCSTPAIPRARVAALRGFLAW